MIKLHLLLLFLMSSHTVHDLFSKWISIKFSPETRGKFDLFFPVFIRFAVPLI